jgi:NADH-quinone oxidoreductase subunit I
MIVSRKESFLEKLYLPAILQGMGITLRRLFKSLFFGGQVTYQYPEKKREYSQRFRGRHFISVDENNVENCTACYLCQTICPAECITIVAEEREEDPYDYGVWKEKRPVSFDVDALRCCFCGFCEEACPKDAIKLSRDYEMAVYTRGQAFYDLSHLTRKVVGRG